MASGNDKPIAFGKYLLDPAGLTIYLPDRGGSIQLSRKEVLHVRDACNDHIERYGAFDLLDREVKLDG